MSLNVFDPTQRDFKLTNSMRPKMRVFYGVNIIRSEKSLQHHDRTNPIFLHILSLRHEGGLVV